MRKRRRELGPWLIAGLFVAAIAAVAAIALASPTHSSRESPQSVKTSAAVPPRDSAAPPPPPRTVPPQPQRTVPAVLVQHGSGARREVALTFDADMTPGMLIRLRAHAVNSWYDSSIVSYLRETATPATVFLTGLWARTYAPIVQTLAHDPLFELANHSFDHYAFSEPCYGLPPVAPASRKSSDVTDATREIVAAGAPRPRYFRFPGGCHSAEDVRTVAAAGERPIGWDVDSGDAFQPSAQVVVRAVLAQVKPGSIVIMHFMGAPNAPATAEALRSIIPALKGRGYRMVTLSHLLAG